jgi:hypothetical protein
VLCLVLLLSVYAVAEFTIAKQCRYEFLLTMSNRGARSPFAPTSTTGTGSPEGSKILSLISFFHYIAHHSHDNHEIYPSAWLTATIDLMINSLSFDTSKSSKAPTASYSTECVIFPLSKSQYKLQPCNKLAI